MDGAARPRELDRDVILRAQDGDAEAFAEIVRTYEARVFNLAFHWTFSRDEANDLTQEIFLRLYKNLDKYDATRDFAPWFMTVAANLCRNWLAKPKLRTVPLGGARRDEADERELEIAAPDPIRDRKTDVQGIVEEVNRAVGDLPPDYRMVVALHYHEGLDVSRIAEVMEIPVGTVKTWLFRARDRLRTKLKRCLTARKG